MSGLLSRLHGRKFKIARIYENVYLVADFAVGTHLQRVFKFDFGNRIINAVHNHFA